MKGLFLQTAPKDKIQSLLGFLDQGGNYSGPSDKHQYSRRILSH